MLGATLPSKEDVKATAKKGVKAYNNLEGNSKKAADIGMLFLGGLAIYTGYRAFKGVGAGFDFITGQKFEEERKADEKKLVTDYTKQLTTQKEKPTITKEKASLIASQLLEGFLNHGGLWVDKIFDSGTDEDEVFEALRQLKNKSDWLLVSATYGMPRGRGLINELGYELDDDELPQARVILSKINVHI